jgi:hypothetical protein
MGDEFLIFGVFVSQKDPFTPKIANEIGRNVSVYVHNISRKQTIGAQQITSRHNRDTNESQLITLRYSFCYHRKIHRNRFEIPSFKKGAEFSFHIKTP